MRTAARTAMRWACVLVALECVGCGRTDREACEAVARPAALCSDGHLVEADLRMTCDDPGDGGQGLGCSNEGLVNQSIINCANAVSEAPTLSDCNAFATCLQNARALCEH